MLSKAIFALEVQTVAFFSKSTPMLEVQTLSCSLKASLRWRYKQLLSKSTPMLEVQSNKQLLSEGIPMLEVQPYAGGTSLHWWY